MLKATPDMAEHIVKEFMKFGVMAKVIGKVVKDGFRINVKDKETKNLWKGGIPCIMK